MFLSNLKKSNSRYNEQMSSSGFPFQAQIHLHDNHWTMYSRNYYEDNTMLQALSDISKINSSFAYNHAGELGDLNLPIESTSILVVKE